MEKGAWTLQIEHSKSLIQQSLVFLNLISLHLKIIFNNICTILTINIQRITKEFCY